SSTDMLSTSVKFTRAYRAGVVDVYHFNVGIKVEDCWPLLALTNTGRFDTPEWDLRFSAHRWRVDVNHPGFDTVAQIKHLSCIVGIDRRCQTILRRIGKLQRFIVILCPYDR